ISGVAGVDLAGVDLAGAALLDVDLAVEPAGRAAVLVTAGSVSLGSSAFGSSGAAVAEEAGAAAVVASACTVSGRDCSPWSGCDGGGATGELAVGAAALAEGSAEGMSKKAPRAIAATAKAMAPQSAGPLMPDVGGTGRSRASAAVRPNVLGVRGVAPRPSGPLETAPPEAAPPGAP